MVVREKRQKQNGRTYGGYWQLVENFCEVGKVKQRVVCYLGKHPSKEEAQRAAELWHEAQFHESRS